MGATGGSFEIFQNGHIFLKFWFFLNIKKKKTENTAGGGPIASLFGPEFRFFYQSWADISAYARYELVAVFTIRRWNKNVLHEVYFVTVPKIRGILLLPWRDKRVEIFL